MEKTKVKAFWILGTVLFILLIGLIFWGCSQGNARSAQKKMIILGFDGVDPSILQKKMDEGLLPNFSELARKGDFKPLGTSMPPQSPVAWSNFITGMNPGGHGIYDFIHRDLTSLLPVPSTTRTEAPRHTLSLGNWRIPLSAGKVELLRKGKAFWEILEAHHIPTTVFRVPANFPPVESEGESLSGMGTPDILGSNGTFSYYTDDPPENYKEISGGVIYPVQLWNHRFEANLVGPQNSFRKDAQSAKIKFTVWRDPENKAVKISLQDYQLLLKEKEWSDWLKVKFELLPGLASVSGICRIYVKEVHPHIRLYVTPINIDPSQPAMPISTPQDYSQEVFEQCGFYYTQGMPEDTKALSWGVFNYEDFKKQSGMVLDESLVLFDYVLNQFQEGLLFYYLSSTDQQMHIFWNMTDPDHPSYDPEVAERYKGVMDHVYESADRLVGKALARADSNTTVVVMSDHGFGPFYRAFNLNRWLEMEGFIKLKDEKLRTTSHYFQNVDWIRTQAYGIGFNGLYLNMRGREAEGSVLPAEREALLQDLTRRLMNLRDPKDGKAIVKRVYRREEIYSGANMDNAPDLIIGYDRGYRASWETAIGNFTEEWISDNMDPWSGTHLNAAELVPGIVLSNKAIRSARPRLVDMAPTILNEFGIAKEDEMVGTSIF